MPQTDVPDEAENWFKDRPIELIPLSKYVDVIKRGTAIELPPIQRGFVWKIPQVEKLWDSLLRGFPIGAFLLSERKSGDKGRTLNSPKQHSSKKEGFFLLDGQQRTRSIMLGFDDSKEQGKGGAPNRIIAKLWIDLATPKKLNSDINDREYMFRLTTSAHPWGAPAKDPDGRLSESKRAGGRKTLGDKQPYDYKLSLEDTWPLDATLPVSLPDLIRLLLRQPEGDIGLQLLDEIKTWGTEHLREKFSAVWDDVISKHAVTVLEALRAVLNESQCIFQLLSVDTTNSTDQANEQNQPEQASSKDQKDRIEELFIRVNSLGTVLSGEELMFSLLKARWDDAYTMVDHITSDEGVGYLLQASSMVQAAIRLARLRQGDESKDSKHGDDPEPTVRDFRRWIDDPDSIFMSILQKLVDKDKDKAGRAIPARLHKCFKEFCSLAEHKDSDTKPSHDVGFPRPLILDLDRYTIQVVLRWIDLNLDDPDWKQRKENSRLPVLRFLMYSLFGLLDNKRSSKRAMIELKKNADFPDKGIYTALRGEVEPILALPLLTLAKFNERFVADGTCDGQMKSYTELFGDSDGTLHGQYFKKFWDNKRLLLWFQRAWLKPLFPGYDPMHKDTADTPYDYDHILPKACIKASGLNLEKKDHIDMSAKDVTRFIDGRDHYLNSIGNLRVWPQFDNRSLQADLPRLRLWLGADDYSASIDCLGKREDLWEASAIRPEQTENWSRASVGAEPRDWMKYERRSGFVHAVEERVKTLYKDLFDTLKYSEWTNDDKK